MNYDGLRATGELKAAGKPAESCYATMYYDGRFKLSVYHGIQFGELYDMENDPQEQHNLWYEDVYKRQLQASRKRRRPARPCPQRRPPADVRAFAGCAGASDAGRILLHPQHRPGHGSGAVSKNAGIRRADPQQHDYRFEQVKESASALIGTLYPYLNSDADTAVQLEEYAKIRRALSEQLDKHRCV